MPEISILDISVANLIAAGEVVDRPASALKELCENAIDAKAKNITAEIKNGGIALMRVTDDGCGMRSEDAVMCVKRHATSKIKTEYDLHSVMTLGFRGEALAAITAVTSTRIMTKRRGESSGTLVEVSYGELCGVAEGGYPDGTMVICERLFAHTPARLKFLKSDSSEGAVCASVVEKLALSHPEISFRFISDGVTRFRTSGDGKLKNAVYSVLGREYASRICEVDASSGGISVSGYIGTPDNVRGNRAMELFFINSRCVRSAQLVSAVEAAFKSFCPIGKFPVCVLNISLGASYVDVNVHPSKQEVKFSDEKSVFDAVYYSVRGALERNLHNPEIAPVPAPKMTEEKLKIISAFMPIDAPKHEQTHFTASAPLKVRRDDDDVTEKRMPAKNVAASTVFPTESAEAPAETHKVTLSTDTAIPSFEPKPVPEYTIIGEAFCCYVIVELENKLLLIDKHAAHERINFERMKANMESEKPDVQLLLIDEKVPLSREEADSCKRYSRAISDVGFIFDAGETGVTLKGIPAGLDVPEGRELFCILMTELSNSVGALDAGSRDYFERSLYQSACKASVKAGRKYDERHVRWIIDNVFRYDCIKRCPHGRPVAVELSKHELDSRFGRIK